MALHIVMFVLLAAVSARFGLLAWNGYRDGQMQPALLLLPKLDRTTQPSLFWMTLGGHVIVTMLLSLCAVWAILGPR